MEIWSNFSAVRLHTDGLAAGLATEFYAKAFTTGTHIYFGTGQYQPQTPGGQQLLAHELVHVLQQTGSQLPESARNPAAASESPVVQRKVIVGGEEWKSKTGEDFLVKQKKQKKPIAGLREILSPMLKSTTQKFSFPNADVLYQYLLQQYWLIKGMSMAATAKCCGYPRPKGIYNWQVNLAARKYWQEEAGHRFSLTKEGTKNADLAVAKLFEKQNDKKDRTLIDCTRMIVALRYYSLLKSMGETAFREAVISGLLEVKITEPWNAPLAASPPPEEKSILTSLLESVGVKTADPKSSALGMVTNYQPKSEDDLVPGDHVYFSNHKNYPLLLDALAKGEKSKQCAVASKEEAEHTCQDIWRGEHAVFIGVRDKQRKFQGHGTGEVTENQMKQNLLNHYNCHVERATRCTPPITSLNSEVLKRLKEEDIPGLRDPKQPKKMQAVWRPRIPSITGSGGKW